MALAPMSMVNAMAGTVDGVCWALRQQRKEECLARPANPSEVRELWAGSSGHYKKKEERKSVEEASAVRARSLKASACWLERMLTEDDSRSEWGRFRL